MSSVIKIERGWAGHFICADRCQFRRNTLLEREDGMRLVVSTVGALQEMPPNRGYSTVGCDRMFETMAFHAKWEDPYWDADTARQVHFESEWAIQPLDRERISGVGLLKFESDAEANDMHEAVVEELTSRMMTGNITEWETEDEKGV